MVDLVIAQGWTYRMVADAMQVSTATVSTWVKRQLAGESLEDHRSRPPHCPGQTPASVEPPILDLRQTTQWPHRIAYQLGMHPSTVHRVVQRHQVPLLHHLDRTTGEPVRPPKPTRYEMTALGALVHVDIKKLGGFRMAVVIGASVARRADARAGRVVVALPTSSMPSIAPRGWGTPRCWTMSARRPPRDAGRGPPPASPALGARAPG